MKRGILAVLLTLCFTAVPALAAEETPQIQPISPWAYDAMSEVNVLGMWSDSYYYCLLDPVTDEQMTDITNRVADKLAQLNLPINMETTPSVLDNTRGGVFNALYQETAAYQIDGIDSGALAFLSDLGVVQGDGTSFAEDRVCTLQEALVMGQRLVLGVYDRMNAGSRGFLWRAENGESVLYLLGTIHVDRNNIYPFHKQLRDVIAGSDDAVFEVDFSDVEDITTFQALQFYSDGTGLKDHVSGELYQKAVSAAAALPAPYGLDETMVGQYKPWALANYFTSAALLDTDTASGAESPVVLDMYVYSKAVNNGVTIGAVESYVYQGQLFDSLTPAYQEHYLESTLDEDESAEASGDIDDWVTDWKIRDIESFLAAYNKDADQAEPDELTELMFGERDKGMIAFAADYLKSAEPQTGILVVGAAHMVGSTGVVKGLQDLGYTVKLMPLP